MIGQGREKEVIAQLVDILGWQPVRGSSTESGMRAPNQLRSLTKKGWRVGHIVDSAQGSLVTI